MSLDTPHNLLTVLPNALSVPEALETLDILIDVAV